MRVLGIDTSNYTTSVAVVDENGYTHFRQILDVKLGDKGLRQSEALFKHNVNLPVLLNKLGKYEIDAVAVSDKPRNEAGSYMPCFLAGLMSASSISSINGIPLYKFSHQEGHIESAIVSSNSGEMFKDEFLSFHVSGGTTELLYVKKKDIGYDVKIICKTLDISCGQLVDRTGVILGLKFPCGKELENLALGASKEIKQKLSMEAGNCNLSGMENKVIQMNNNGEKPENIAMFSLNVIANTIIEMTKFARETYSDLPIIYVGGVMSDNIIRNKIIEKIDNCFFASNELSSDNAVGIAYLGFNAMKG